MLKIGHFRQFSKSCRFSHIFPSRSFHTRNLRWFLNAVQAMISLVFPMFKFVTHFLPFCLIKASFACLCSLQSFILNLCFQIKGYKHFMGKPICCANVHVQLSCILWHRAPARTVWRTKLNNFGVRSEPFAKCF